jgi:outer membrane protein assembly factor BamA
MRNRQNSRHHPPLLLTVVGLLAFLCCATLSAAQAQNTLRKIEIVGLQRLAPDQVIQSSGLQVGQTVDQSMIEAASDKLMKSGLFRSVSYRVRSADNETIVIFEVVENPPGAQTRSAPLGQVTWLNNQVFSREELSAIFGLQPGQPGSRTQIDQGLEAVRKAYAKKGYITTSIFEVKAVDVPTGRTNYRFTVQERAQYRMGALIITGLTPADRLQLKSKWTLAGGAIFDDSYPDQFKQNTVRPFVAAMTGRTGVRTKFDFETKPDVRKQTVDVVINFR